MSDKEKILAAINKLAKLDPQLRRKSNEASGACRGK
jgi:hypothetical protein